MSASEPKNIAEQSVSSTETQTPAKTVAKAALTPAATPKSAAVPAKSLPTKVARKPAAKKVPAAAAKTLSQPAKAAPLQAKVEKLATQKKPKLVRDSFTIPKAEYTVLDELKYRSIKLAIPAKKSELLRAGIKALAAMSDSSFAAAMKAVPTIKTGRPAKN